MRVSEIWCGICKKVISQGQPQARRITWKSLNGAGDYTDTHTLIVHIGECLVTAQDRAYVDEHPYGPDGVDLGSR